MLWQPTRAKQSKPAQQTSQRHTCDFGTQVFISRMQTEPASLRSQGVYHTRTWNPLTRDVVPAKAEGPELRECMRRAPGSRQRPTQRIGCQVELLEGWPGAFARPGPGQRGPKAVVGKQQLLQGCQRAGRTPGCRERPWRKAAQLPEWDMSVQFTVGSICFLVAMKT